VTDWRHTAECLDTEKPQSPGLRPRDRRSVPRHLTRWRDLSPCVPSKGPPGHTHLSRSDARGHGRDYIGSAIWMS